MNFLNPKAIVDREIQKTRRAVNAPAELFALANQQVGERVFVRSRKAEFELLKQVRGQYLEINSTSGDNLNYVTISGAASGVSPLPVGTKMTIECRLDTISNSSVAVYDFRFGSSFRAGFMRSSGLTRFRPTWHSIGGGIASISDNGSGSARIVTNSAHGCTTGDSVYVTGVTGTGSTNITALYWNVAVIDSNTIDLIGSSFTGTPTGGTVNNHLKFSIIDLDGISQDSESLAEDKWLLVTLEVQRAALTLDGAGLRIGPYYQNHRIHLRRFEIDTGTEELKWDFTLGTLVADEGETLTVTESTPENVRFVEDDLLGDNMRYIEQVSPYKLYEIRPNGGWVTPENFGAIKQYTTANTDPAIDATAIVQACLDSPYNVLCDGYYYTPGVINITKAKTIHLLGSSDGVRPPGKDEAVGCFYQGETPGDMFRIFAGGVRIIGGMLDSSNCIYDTGNANLAAYYVPPSFIKYYFWANLIQWGEVNTFFNGSELRTRVYKGGHIGVSFDCSRVPAGDPQTRPGGFSEMHYVDFKLAANFIHCLVDARLGEPHQDYTAILTHDSVDGFKVTNTPVAAIPPKGGNDYLCQTPATNYVVDNNAFKIMTLKWGTHSAATIKVVNSGGSWIDRINEAIARAGLSLNTQIATDTTPAFRAEARSGGINQAFAIRSNMSTFSLVCVRPCLPTVFRYDLTDVGCKYTAHFETADSADLRAFCQTALTLSERPSAVDGITPNEYAVPKIFIGGDGFNHDIQTIDLGKGNLGGPPYRSNIQGWVDDGRKNQPFDSSLAGFETSTPAPNVTLRSEQRSTPESLKGFIRNARHFSHTRYHRASTGKDGFVGFLDNVLAMGNKKWSVAPTYAVYENTGFNLKDIAPATGSDPLTWEAAPSRATVANLENLFNIEGSLPQITWNSDFDADNDFIELMFEGFGGGLDLVAGYLEFYTANKPKRVQLHVIGSTATMMEFTCTGSNQWYHFDTFNNGTTNMLVLRLIGAMDKNAVCQIGQFAGVTKNFAWSKLPFLSNAGGLRVFNTTEFEGLRIKDTGTTYRTIVPQASPPASPTTEQLRAALVAAGIFF